MRCPLRLKIKYVNLSGGQHLGLLHLAAPFLTAPLGAWSGGWRITHWISIREMERGGKNKEGSTDGKRVQCYRRRSTDSLYQNLFLKNGICFLYIVSLEVGEMQKSPSLHSLPRPLSSPTWQFPSLLCAAGMI